MGSIIDQINTAFRDYVIDGITSSGPHEVVKSDVRAVGPLIESAISNAALGALISVAYATRAELAADLAHDADAVGFVHSDSTDDNNDLYVKTGASGAGSWTLTTIIHDAVAGLVTAEVAAQVAPQVALAEGYAIDAQASSDEAQRLLGRSGMAVAGVSINQLLYSSTFLATAALISGVAEADMKRLPWRFADQGSGRVIFTNRTTNYTPFNSFGAGNSWGVNPWQTRTGIRVGRPGLMMGRELGELGSNRFACHFLPTSNTPPYFNTAEGWRAICKPFKKIETRSLSTTSCTLPAGAGSPVADHTFTEDDVERVGWIIGYSTDQAGLHLVEIWDQNGDPLTPNGAACATGQQWVDVRGAPSAILIANGGTIDPAEYYASASFLDNQRMGQMMQGSCFLDGPPDGLFIKRVKTTYTGKKARQYNTAITVDRGYHTHFIYGSATTDVEDDGVDLWEVSPLTIGLDTSANEWLTLHGYADAGTASLAILGGRHSYETDDAVPTIYVDGVAVKYDISVSYKARSGTTGGTVTLTIPSGHGLQVGGKITVSGMGDNFDAPDVEITAVTDTTVSYVWTGSATDAGSAAAGRIVPNKIWVSYEAITGAKTSKFYHPNYGSGASQAAAGDYAFSIAPFLPFTVEAIAETTVDMHLGNQTYFSLISFWGYDAASDGDFASPGHQKIRPLGGGAAQRYEANADASFLATQQVGLCVYHEDAGIAEAAMLEKASPFPTWSNGASFELKDRSNGVDKAYWRAYNTTTAAPAGTLVSSKRHHWISDGIASSDPLFA